MHTYQLTLLRMVSSLQPMRIKITCRNMLSDHQMLHLMKSFFKSSVATKWFTFTATVKSLYKKFQKPIKSAFGNLLYKVL